VVQQKLRLQFHLKNLLLVISASPLDDLMSSLKDLRSDFSDLFKKHSASQTSQFKELKKYIMQLSALLEEVKAENQINVLGVIFDSKL
jgi:hypothetical protein